MASDKDFMNVYVAGRLARELAHSLKGRMTRHGFPAAKTPAGIGRVTTLPAPITVRSPMLTPGQMTAPPPTQTSEPIETGLANSRPVRRSAASIGWEAV